MSQEPCYFQVIRVNTHIDSLLAPSILNKQQIRDVQPVSFRWFHFCSTWKFCLSRKNNEGKPHGLGKPDAHDWSSASESATKLPQILDEKPFTNLCWLFGLIEHLPLIWFYEPHLIFFFMFICSGTSRNTISSNLSIRNAANWI